MSTTNGDIDSTNKETTSPLRNETGFINRDVMKSIIEKALEDFVNEKISSEGIYAGFFFNKLTKLPARGRLIDTPINMDNISIREFRKFYDVWFCFLRIIANDMETRVCDDNNPFFKLGLYNAFLEALVSNDYYRIISLTKIVKNIIRMIQSSEDDPFYIQNDTFGFVQLSTSLDEVSETSSKMLDSLNKDVDSLNKDVDSLNVNDYF